MLSLSTHLSFPLIFTCPNWDCHEYILELWSLCAFHVCLIANFSWELFRYSWNCIEFMPGWGVVCICGVFPLIQIAYWTPRRSSILVGGGGGEFHKCVTLGCLVVYIVYIFGFCIICVIVLRSWFFLMESQALMWARIWGSCALNLVWKRLCKFFLTPLLFFYCNICA